MEKEIAVRMFENTKFGTTYGKGLYRTAVFNATVELRDPHAKYLLDFHDYHRWVNSARSDDQMDFVKGLESEAASTDLASWVVHYDPVTKTKTPVIGVAILDLNNQILKLLIYDQERGVESVWSLQTCACSVKQKNSPTLIATNTELAQW